jgi:hypothetical protein
VVETETSPKTATSFSAYATTGITVNITDATVDKYKDYLFYVTAGTYAGKGFIIDSNDASTGGTCKLYFRHPLSVALSATKVTAASLINPDYYVIMKYASSFDTLTAVGDEIGIDDKYERRIVKAWLNWKILQEVDPSSDQTLLAEKDYEKVLRKLKREMRSSTGGRIMPRDIPGFSQFKGNIDTVTYAEEM